MGGVFNPYTEAELFNLMITKKRELISSEGLKWTSESPSDLGVAVLRCNAHVGGVLTEYVAERTKQNYIIYAIDDLAVHATTRALGYKIRNAIPAQLKVSVTTNAAQSVPAGSVLTKETDDGITLKFETLEDLTFTGAGTQTVYALQGETHVTTETADGTEFQKVVISDFPVAYGSVVVINNGNTWTEVTDFIDSTSISKHYVVEYDFTGQPTIIFGDGEFGVKPESGTLITVAWRTCDGQIGNLAPGEMEFERNFASVTSVTNEAPASGELASAVSAGASTITLTDDGSISSFQSTGVAYIDEDSFTYTGKSGNSFTGCTGLEEPHLTGEEVTYSLTYTYGANRETNKQAKVSAIRWNRTKGSCNSLLDYSYFARQVPGVARARAVCSNNVISIQIIPNDTGIPSASLLGNVYDYLAVRKNALHTITVINPIYIYIDVVAKVSPAAGYSFEDSVKADTLSEIQSFLNPLTTDESNLYYLNGWGNLLKKNLLEARIFYMNEGLSVSDVELTTFKISTAFSGAANIQLSENQIAHVGSIQILNKDITAEMFPGETSGYQSVNTLPNITKSIL